MSNVSRPDIYKSYQFRLNLSGGVLNINVLYNSIGNIVWSKTNVGQYVATLANAFPIAKTFVIPISSEATDFQAIGILNPVSRTQTGWFYFRTGNVNQILFQVVLPNGTFQDVQCDFLGEIRVYP